MKRIIRNIEEGFKKAIFGGKILILYGPRQVGKTTFIKNILKDYEEKGIKVKYLQCESFAVSSVLATQNVAKILDLVDGAKIVVFDEAQTVPDIGKSIKVFYDTYPELQIILTGSSAFDLSQKVAEPMTGRYIDFMLFSPNYREVKNFYGGEAINKLDLENILLYGSYPEVLDPKNNESKKDVLMRIANDYTLKDVLNYSGIRKSDKLILLLKILANQMGEEVSYQEIGENYGFNTTTLENYVDILEKAFIIFRLDPYSGNERMSLRRKRKIYFYDNGLRNAIVNNFESLNGRADKGKLFENFIISEIKKKNLSQKEYFNLNFWRAYNGEEIDLLKIKDGKIEGLEIKWKLQKDVLNKSEKSPVETVRIINKENFQEFI